LLLAFCGYLIRSYEFLLVLLIALPLLPWVRLAKDRVAQASVFVLLFAISVAAFVDYRAYQGDDWQAFNALNPVRTPITDFGADTLLKEHPEILARHNYTVNDIGLIRLWFFVDPKIADPVSLNAMLEELGPLPTQSNTLANGWIGIETLAHPVLLPILSAALLLLLILPSRKLFVTWVLCLAAIFVLGMLGRPGVLRVYIPVLSLLLIAPLLVQGILRQRLVLGVAVVATFFSTTAVFSESRTAQAVSEQIRRDLQGFPTEPVVVWGGLFPFESTYPVLKQSDSAMAYKLWPGCFYACSIFTILCRANSGKWNGGSAKFSKRCANSC